MFDSWWSLLPWLVRRLDRIGAVAAGDPPQLLVGELAQGLPLEHQLLRRTWVGLLLDLVLGLHRGGLPSLTFRRPRLLASVSTDAVAHPRHSRHAIGTQSRTSPQH